MNLLEWLCVIVTACIFVPLGLGFLLMVWIGFSMWRDESREYGMRAHLRDREEDRER